MAKAKTMWVEVVYCPPGGGEESASFVARTDLDGFLAADDGEFWRFEYVRWLDENEQPTPNELDDGFGTDHYMYIRKGVIYRVDPIRGEYVARWDDTVPPYDRA